jgi:hypothetical protein
MRSMPRAALVYVSAVLVVGYTAVAAALTHAHLDWSSIALFSALYWIGDAAPVGTRHRSLAISTSFPVALAAVLLVGGWSACIICSIGVVAGLQRVAWFKRAFNGAQMALSAVFAGTVYGVMPGGGTGSFAEAHFPGCSSR